MSCVLNIIEYCCLLCILYFKKAAKQRENGTILPTESEKFCATLKIINMDLHSPTYPMVEWKIFLLLRVLSTKQQNRGVDYSQLISNCGPCSSTWWVRWERLGPVSSHGHCSRAWWMLIWFLFPFLSTGQNNVILVVSVRGFRKITMVVLKYLLCY